MSPPVYLRCDSQDLHEQHVHVIDHGSSGVYTHICRGVRSASSSGASSVGKETP